MTPLRPAPRWTRLRDALRGRQIPDDAYLERHTALQLVLAAHVVALAGYAVLTRSGHLVLEAVPLLVLLWLSAALPGRRARATAASLGLYACSAIVVHLAGGVTEAHFHFFVVLALVSLYRDAVPYLIGIGFVLVEHFVVGSLASTAVFEHDGPPLTWALIHAAFVAAASAAHLASWRTVERVHRDERDALSAEIARLAAVVDDAGVAILSEDLDGTIRSWNAAAAAMFGYQTHEVVGRSATVLLPGREDELEQNLTSVRLGRSRSYEGQRVTRDGAVLDLAVLVSPVRDSSGEVVGASLILRDVTRQKAAERALAAQQAQLTERGEQLSRLAYRDPLTGLANRAQFLDELAAAGRTDDHEHSVLMLDLDGFKLVNDSAGHAAGDQLLVQAAERLSACVQPEDVVARLGGDEFALLLRRAEPDAVADVLLLCMAEPYTIDGRLLSAPASLGIAVAAPGTSAGDLLRNADVALYAAKAAGKNRALRYDQQMYERVLRRTQLEAHLRGALEHEQLAVHYQPVVSMAEGEVEGFEALLRWECPGLGAVSPAEFIPLAETTGLIVPIGSWVLRQATRQAALLTARAGRPVSVAVNVSIRQLERPDFPQLVAAALADTDLPPGQLVLEVTESALADSAAAVVAALHRLRASGVRVAIDDFGTGYSSLDRLRTLPVDQLKVDRSFISEIAPGSTRGDTPVLAAIFAMAAALGLRTVAEGVETEQQFAALRRMGCHDAQGFLMSRPVRVSEAGELLAYSRPFGALGSHEQVLGGGEVDDVVRLIQAATEAGGSSDVAIGHLLRAVCSVTGLETAFLSAVGPDGELHRVLFAHPAHGVVQADERREWSRSVCSAAAASGTWASSDVAGDYPGAAAGDVRSFVGVPLLSADGALRGTLCAVDRVSKHVDAPARDTLAFLSRLITEQVLPMQGLRPRTVVVVDDSDVSRRLLEAALLALGPYEVVGHAVDLVQAVQVCTRLHPDIVLLDVELPDSRGRAAVAQIAAATPHSRVVVVSGSARHRASSLADGADAFLTKDALLQDLGLVLAAPRQAPDATAVPAALPL